MYRNFPANSTVTDIPDVTHPSKWFMYFAPNASKPTLYLLQDTARDGSQVDIVIKTADSTLDIIHWNNGVSSFPTHLYNWNGTAWVKYYSGSVDYAYFAKDDTIKTSDGLLSLGVIDYTPPPPVVLNKFFPADSTVPYNGDITQPTRWIMGYSSSHSGAAGLFVPTLYMLYTSNGSYNDLPVTRVHNESYWGPDVDQISWQSNLSRFTTYGYIWNANTFAWDYVFAYQDSEGLKIAAGDEYKLDTGAVASTTPQIPSDGFPAPPSGVTKYVIGHLTNTDNALETLCYALPDNLSSAYVREQLILVKEKDNPRIAHPDLVVVGEDVQYQLYTHNGSAWVMGGASTVAVKVHINRNSAYKTDKGITPAIDVIPVDLNDASTFPTPPQEIVNNPAAHTYGAWALSSLVNFGENNEDLLLFVLIGVKPEDGDFFFRANNPANVEDDVILITNPAKNYYFWQWIYNTRTQLWSTGLGGNPIEYTYERDVTLDSYHYDYLRISDGSEANETGEAEGSLHSMPSGYILYLGENNPIKTHSKIIEANSAPVLFTEPVEGDPPVLGTGDGTPSDPPPADGEFPPPEDQDPDQPIKIRYDDSLRIRTDKGIMVIPLVTKDYFKNGIEIKTPDGKRYVLILNAPPEEEPII